jgi:anaerobic selenocysteine-containing dehydrogenase
MDGGVTETSTERRIIYSPTIPGPRVAEAWPEWRIFTTLASRTRPEVADRLAYDGTAAIRADIARSVPAYAGIEKLATFGDQVQYGGPLLCDGWTFPTPDGKAHFSAVPLPEVTRADGGFVLATRRGKQFNSMVHERRDSLTGALREAVLISPGDADRLGLADGTAVVLASPHGTLDATVQRAPVSQGTVQVHWPEGNVLLDHAARSAESGIPDYNTVVTVKPVVSETPKGAQ